MIRKIVFNKLPYDDLYDLYYRLESLMTPVSFLEI